MTAFAYMPDWTIETKHETAQEWRVEGFYSLEPDTCPKCGTVNDLYKHGSLDVAVRDAPLWGKPLHVTVHRKRYRCRSCGGTFVQPLPDIDDKRHMTRRCVKFIQDQSVKRSYRDIADQIGVDPKTVWAVVQEHFETLQASFTVEAPEYLGMDETAILRAQRCILTDVGKRKVLDLLPGRTQGMVSSWLYHLPNRDRIKAVSIDMWLPYKRAITQVLPEAVIVVDRFHVSAMANHGLDFVRKVEGNKKTVNNAGRVRLMRSRWLLLKRDKDLNDENRFKRDTWLQTFPRLKTAYWLKETFLDLWEIEDKAKARAALHAWRKGVPKAMEPSFKVLLTALGNWETEILAYWYHQITAGYTEAMNKTIKNIARGGPNYSFDAIRTKLLFKKAGHAEIRCSVCFGLFTPKELDHERLKGKDEQPICHSCNRQFHTDTYLAPK